MLPKLDLSALTSASTALVCLTVAMSGLALQQPKTRQAHMRAPLKEMLRPALLRGDDGFCQLLSLYDAPLSMQV